MLKLITYVLLFFSIAVTSCSTADILEQNSTKNSVEIVVGGKSRAAILLGEHVTSPERHAGDELRNYIKQMTGAEVPILSEDEAKVDNYSNLVLVGTPASNNALSNLNKNNLIKVVLVLLLFCNLLAF